MGYSGGGGSARGTFHWTLDFSWETAPREAGQTVTDPIAYVRGGEAAFCGTRIDSLVL